jgi:hypothetical protein
MKAATEAATKLGKTRSASGTSAVGFGVGTALARGGSMLDVALTLLALIGGGFAVELFATGRAPLGYPEERGFRLSVGLQEAGEEFQCGNPS